MSVVTFRVLLVIQASLTLLSWSLPFTPVRLTPEMHDLLSQSGTGSVAWAGNPMLYWGSFVASLASIIGMFLFYRWARTLGVVVVVLLSLLQLLGGIRIDAPFDGFVGSVTGTINIVLLTVAFLPSLADRFRMRALEPAIERTDSVGHEVSVEPPQPATELVEVLSSGDESLLAVLESVLNEHGVEFAISGDQLQDLFAAGRIGGYNFALGPARVLVRAKDAALAKQLIREITVEPESL